MSKPNLLIELTQEIDEIMPEFNYSMDSKFAKLGIIDVITRKTSIEKFVRGINTYIHNKIQHIQRYIETDIINPISEANKDSQYLIEQIDNIDYYFNQYLKYIFAQYNHAKMPCFFDLIKYKDMDFVNPSPEHIKQYILDGIDRGYLNHHDYFIRNHYAWYETKDAIKIYDMDHLEYQSFISFLCKKYTDIYHIEIILFIEQYRSELLNLKNDCDNLILNLKSIKDKVTDFYNAHKTQIKIEDIKRKYDDKVFETIAQNKVNIKLIKNETECLKKNINNILDSIKKISNIKTNQEVLNE